MVSLRIGKTEIGTGHRPYVIAEAGVHHYGSVALAKDYIAAAADAGAQAIKFQTYTAAALTTTWAELYWNDPRYKSQFDVFKEKKSLSTDDYRELADFAAECGIDFLSTPFDIESADMLNALGMPAFKIASADLTCLPLLRHIADFGKPMLLSTGASYFDEIAATVSAIGAINNQIALLHCSLAYPTPLKDANLARIDALKIRFSQHVIGYSDHTRPDESELACPLAAMRGARIIEKHFTLDRSLAGDDHYHAVDPAGLRRLVKNCGDAVAMVGNGAELSDAELPARRGARRSIVAARDLKAGTVLTANDLAFKRPGHGLPPSEYETLLGLRLKRDVVYDGLILREDLG
jgi:N-acetylneuraminate synthase